MDTRRFNVDISDLMSIYVCQALGIIPTYTRDQMELFLRYMTDDRISFTKHRNTRMYDFIDEPSSNPMLNAKSVFDVFEDGTILTPDAVSLDLDIFEIKVRGNKYPNPTITFDQVEKYKRLSEIFGKLSGKSDLRFYFVYVNYDFVEDIIIKDIKSSEDVRSSVELSDIYVIPWKVLENNLPKYVKKKENTSNKHFSISKKIFEDIHNTDRFSTDKVTVDLDDSEFDIRVVENGERVYQGILENAAIIEKKGNLSGHWDSKLRRYKSDMWDPLFKHMTPKRL